MLPARNRMRRSADFRVAVRAGRRVGRASLVLHLATGGMPAAPPRAGFVVSRSVGSAVARNRVKRRLRAAVCSVVGDLPAGALLVVRANPAAAVTSWPDLQRDVRSALTRALAPAGAVPVSRSGPAGPAAGPKRGA